jgi:hypothetical protein
LIDLLLPQTDTIKIFSSKQYSRNISDMKYIALLLSTLSTLVAAAGVTDSVVYAEGDTTCSGVILKYTRVPDPAGTCAAISSQSGCIRNSQGKDLPISTSSRFFCSNSMNDMPPKSLSGPVKSYAVRQVYAGGKCTDNAADLVQVDGLMTGGCYRFGPSYFSASCSAGGKVSWLSCSDQNCRQCNTTFSAKDGECDSGLYQYKCVTLEQMKSTDPSVTGSAAIVTITSSGVMAAMLLLVPAAALYIL